MASSPWSVVDVCDSDEDDDVQVRASVPRERNEEEEQPDVDDVALRRKGHHHGTSKRNCSVSYASTPCLSRVCLVTSFGMKPLDEAQCPICRVAILYPLSTHALVDAVLSVNLLVPSVLTRIHTYGHEEDRTYRHALAKLTTAWNVLTRLHQAVREDREGPDDASVRVADDRPGPTVEYPVLKLDETEEANVHIARTIVLDRSDEKEGGSVHMRVGLAIQAFQDSWNCIRK
ncbi:hypothetical protein PsorP6_006422 [Peronosclerospora sorghi]|uniref:Uncharacterized protein n=1 Tax=Peronosclerospora sorghi TaxID=230839 RepID=A0ACC0W5G4_9STRA|nr:hypothetical protein PsorP6_006422 [Peronosclerospora sorghi]